MATPTEIYTKHLAATRAGAYGVYQFTKYIAKDSVRSATETQELLTELSEDYVAAIDVRLGANTLYANSVSDLHNNTLDAGDTAIIAALT